MTHDRSQPEPKPQQSHKPDAEGSNQTNGADAGHLIDPAVGPIRLVDVWRWSKRGLQVGIPLLVVWLIWRELHTLDIHTVRLTLVNADWNDLASGLAAAFGAVVVMGLYDAVAFPRGANGTLTTGRRWVLGSVLFGWTNFISLGPVGGPALRLIAYRRYGLTGPEITRGLFGHYLGSASGLAAWLLAAWVPLPTGIGGVADVVVRVMIALGCSVGIPVLVGRILMPIGRRHRYGSDLEGAPLARLGLVAFFDWGLTLVSFWFLTRAVGAEFEVPDAARAVFTGQFAGIVSMVPGGLGSADAVWFKAFALLDIPHDTAAAAVVMFRAGFYFLPWVVAMGVLYTALAMRSDRVRLWQRRLVAGAVMLNAVLLLLSAATPALRDRLDMIAKAVPLGAIEVSHTLATVSAGLMLFLVRGLLRGYRGAYVLTVALLAASAVAHPLKGGDYEEALVSVALLVLLIGVRGAFTRRGRVPIGWEVLLAAGVGAAAMFMVTGFAAFDQIPYRHELWVTFGERAEASRFLRGGLVLVVLGLAIAVRQAVRPARLWVTPTREDLDRAERFVREHASNADALLVCGADKGVWFFEPKPGVTSGLVLYQRHGDRLIVFKDPVLGPGVEPASLIDELLRFAEDLDVDVVFSMVSTDWMGHLHDFGFHFLKVNEEAIVPLVGYSLDGGKNAQFRRTLRDMEKARVTFELMEPPYDDATIDGLRVVSDGWLVFKGGHELQFSACCFSPGYLQRNPLAVAREASGEIIAFVNVLATRPGGPATLDLMRYVPDRVDCLMDYVLLKTMLTLSERGYSSFSLGAAPLSDVGIWKGSRPAERLLHLFSTKAERVYNYQGLLKYKKKFHPDWEARYLAFQQPWDWATALIASVRLVQARGRADRRRIAAARLGQPWDERP